MFPSWPTHERPLTGNSTFASVFPGFSSGLGQFYYTCPMQHLFYFAGSGFKLSPVVGKILFQLAFDLKPINDMEPFKIARFQKSSL